MEESKPVVVGIDELLWDVFPDVKKAGGTSVNFVYHATRLGAEGYAINAVGDDVFGTETIQELDKNGIDSNYVSTVEYLAGSVMVELKNGIPSYTIVEGVARDYIPLTQASTGLMKRADAVCFGTLAQRAAGSRETLRTLLSYMPSHVLRFSDINIRQHFYSKELIKSLLELANVFKTNDEELEMLRPMFGLESTIEDMCRWFMKKYGLRYLVLAAGAEYSTIFSEGEVSTIPTPKVQVVDTVGAGDPLSGAFILSILIGKPLHEAHEKAAKVAAYACTQSGTWPAYPKDLQAMSEKTSSLKLAPVTLAFFVMGFMDLVGITSNYLKADLGLSDSEVNIFPSPVFFWFLIFSVPTGMLMNCIGRKKTVLLSLVVTSLSLMIPIFNGAYMVMLISFSLLGIGNALMQTSLNPLLSNIVNGDELASPLTFGQLAKAIVSFLAPYITMWGITQVIPSMGLGWRVLSPVYMVIAVIAILLLRATTIHETKEEGWSSTFGECLALLGKPLILLCLIGIMCHVGIDVGTNTAAPKILMECLGMTLADAGFATSLYFIFHTAGYFSGAFILRKVSPKGFFVFSVFLTLLAMIGLLLPHSKEIIYAYIVLIGFGNSNISPIIFAQALLSMPNKQNKVFGLMTMGLFGGTIFPIFMGVAPDMLASQVRAVLVLCVGVAYLLFFTPKLSKQ